MMRKFLKLRDKIMLWIIIKFKLDIPDLQQTPHPKEGVYYYYYGRLVKLVRNPHCLRLRAENLTVEELRILRECNQFDPKEVRQCQQLRTHVYDDICSRCALHQLALPCHKEHNYRAFNDQFGRRRTSVTQPRKPQDLCFKYHYELIKGLPNDTITE